MKNHSRANYSFVVGILTVLMASPAQALVGSTPGQFSVNPAGAATYSIPIQVPPGIAGMQPQLSFFYSSNSGNGLLGLGWNLAGLSEIGRCPATQHQDSLIDGIDFDSNDKFCLDGQRLVPLSSSPTTGTDSYGTYTEEYRTEIETFSRVRSYGTAGGGPASFRVWNRNGQLMEYGVTADSRIEAQGKSDVLVWAINKATDTSGNYMTVTYTENSTNGEFRASQIDYTGNSGQSVSTYASVQFTWATRSDTILHYLGGSLKKTTQRLTNVKTYVGATLVKDYRLTYGSYGAASLSRLTAITECDGQTTAECLPATQFTWSGGPEGFASAGSYEPPTGYVANKEGEFADVNGDGLMDWVFAHKYPGGMTVKTTYLNTGSGWDAGTNFGQLPTVIIDAAAGQRMGEFADVDADGLPDWVVAYENASGASTKETYLNTGSGWDTGGNFGDLPTVITDYDTLSTGERKGEFVDVNGDGRPDWVLAYENSGGTTTKETYLNTGSGWDTGGNFGDLPTVITDYDTVSTGERLGEFVDLNGDGLPDWVRAYENWGGTATRTTYLNTGSGWSSNSSYQLPTVIMDYHGNANGARYGKFVDVNGDGLLDWVHLWVNSTTWLNTGASWQSNSSYALPSAGSVIGHIEFVDVNGDGLIDALRAYQDANNQYVKTTWLNTDGGWQSDSDYILPSVVFATVSGRIGEFVDVNGDGISDWLCGWNFETGNTGGWLNESEAPGLLVLVTGGYGSETAVTYKYLTDDSVYTKGTGAAYPEVDVQTAMPVVSQVTSDNGIGGDLVMNYSYAGLKSDYARRQLLGYASTKVVDAGTEIQTITNYNQGFPYSELPSLVEKKKSDNVLFSSMQYSYDGQGAFNCGSTNVPVVCRVFEKTYDFDSGAALTEVTTDTDYDAYNNPVTVTIQTEDVRTVGGGDIFIAETNNDYADNPATLWKFGLLSRSEVQQTLPDTSLSPVRTAAYNYDSNGLLIRGIVEPDSTNQNMRLTTAYVRDGFGNITRTTLCDGAITPANCDQNSANARSTQAGYTSNDASYPNGLFVTGVTNALNQSESRVYDLRFGVVTSLTGPNGLTTEWDYDSLGRQVLEDRADGTLTETTYENCSSCPEIGGALAIYTVTTEVTGRAPQVMYLDAFNREIRRRTTYDGTNYVHVDTEYDARGRVDQVSEPHFSGATAVWTVYAYDAIDRVISVDPAHTVELISTDYNGFSTTLTNVKDQVKLQTVNAIGQLVSVTEADGTADEVTTAYRYDAAGNLEETEVNDDDATIIHIDYDVRGRKTALDDPDMGAWSYVHNAFGELISQTDAKSQVTTMEYDVLGRMTLRVDDDGGDDIENTWTWGTSSANKNIGKLAGMSVEGGSSASYTYDSLGRPSQTTHTIGSNNFVVTQSYDGTTGMPAVTTYPATTKYSSGFQVRRVYNSSGVLIRVETTDTVPFVFWQADAADRNARSQVEAETLGNGIDTVRVFDEATGWLEATESINSALDAIHHAAYTYDDLGNLLSRTDHRLTVEEEFSYDNLNRILTSQRTGQPVPIEYAYDALGNITAKGGVDVYSYTGCSAGPHAVCMADGNSYGYDANGNMTTRDGRTVTYTGFNLPYEFKNGSTVQAAFEYDANRNRVLKTAGSLEVRYIGMTGTGNPLFEQEYDGTTTRNIHYIYADGAQAVAQHIAIGTNTETQYLHRDHLGSVEAISDDSGDLVDVDYVSYDAWGSRLDDPDAENVRLGFTGHETIAEQTPDLVHMNGRVYDPAIARFVSADPTIPDPFSSQSYNRYSYVSNNPLSLTDPSGFAELSTDPLHYESNGAMQEGVDRANQMELLEGQNLFTCDEACRERGALLDSTRMSFTDTSSSGYYSFYTSYYASGGGGGYYNTNNDFGDSSELGAGRLRSYSPNKPGWHNYVAGPNMVCSATLKCSKAEMADQLSRFAVPGQDPSKPVTDFSINEVYDPRYDIYAGEVTTYISADGLTITNVTMPGHVFHDGQIERSVLQGSDGAWYVTTHGTGNNELPGAATLNQWQGPKIFDYVDTQMRNNIEAHH